MIGCKILNVRRDFVYLCFFYINIANIAKNWKKLLKFCINLYHKHIVDREVNAILNEIAIKSIMISEYICLGMY